MSNDFAAALQRAVADAIQRETDALTESEISKAVASFEAALREAVGRVAVNASGYYSMERMDQNLVITVKQDRIEPNRPVTR